MVDALSAIQQSSVRSQIDTAVVKKAMDVEKANGEAMIALLESAAQSQGGRQGVKVAPAASTIAPGSLDVTA